MNVLVTGNLGYVGLPLVNELQLAGHTVSGMDIGLYQACHWQGNLPQVRQLQCDIRDATISDLEGFDVVIHLAGLSNDPLGELDPELTQDINTKAGLHLATLARQSDVRRMVVVSSCSVYGAAGDRWLNESSATAPVTAYARSKLALEQGLADIPIQELEVVIARPGTVYGVSPAIRFDLVLNNLVAWACATGNIHFKSDGEAWRPLLHVRDLASCLRFLAEAESNCVADEAYNIGYNHQNIQVSQLADIIGHALPEARLTQDEKPSHDPRSYRVDCSKLAQAGGPEARFSLADGVRELVDTLRDHPVAVSDFEGCRYQRVAHLNLLMRQARIDHRLRRLT